jgi:hypothetical protein
MLLLVYGPIIGLDPAGKSRILVCICLFQLKKCAHSAKRKGKKAPHILYSLNERELNNRSSLLALHGKAPSVTIFCWKNALYIITFVSEYKFF